MTQMPHSRIAAPGRIAKRFSCLEAWVGRGRPPAGTSYSQISRIESGRHRTSLGTLARIAHALDLRLPIGFEQNLTVERQLVAP